MPPVLASFSLCSHRFKRRIGLKRAQQFIVGAAVLVQAGDDCVNHA